MIKNPEIASLVPTLLMGLTDPNDHTKYSLDILLQVGLWTEMWFQLLQSIISFVAIIVCSCCADDFC